MKKTILSFLLISSGMLAMAQDYTKVLIAYNIKKYEDAKKEIDKLAADNKAKDKPETYLWQAAINSQLFSDSVLFAKYPGSDKAAFDAFNTYIEKDPTLKLLKEGTSASAISGIAYLYSTSFNNGKKYFTQSNWPEAFNNFQRATALGEFISKNGFNATKSLIDTFTVLYTGYAAQNMAKPDTAVTYYQKLADLKTGGADMQPMYQYMLDDLAKMNQPDKFAKYLAIAKELYPAQSAMWSQIEMGNMSQNSSIDQIMDKYNQEKGTALTEDQLVNYAESFANIQQLQKLDSTKQLQYRLTAAEAYEKAFGLNPNQGIYAYNAGLLNYNVYDKLSDKYYGLRGEGASLKLQRVAVAKEQQVYVDTSIMWLEKGYQVLKSKSQLDRVDSSSLNKMVDMLASLYTWKRDQTKGAGSATSSKDYDKYDAKFQQFDAEHDKYKLHSVK